MAGMEVGSGEEGTWRSSGAKGGGLIASQLMPLKASLRHRPAAPRLSDLEYGKFGSSLNRARAAPKSRLVTTILLLDDREWRLLSKSDVPRERGR